MGRIPNEVFGRLRFVANQERDWCERVSRLEIDMMVPQHGAIYQGPDVQRFINWFAALEVGVLRG